MSLAIDGTPQTRYAGSASSWTHTISTSKANDVIIVDCAPNGGPITGISSPTLGSFTLRNRGSNSSSLTVERWYAIAPSTLSSEVITVTATSSGFYSSVAYAVSGANTLSLWDTGTANSTSSPYDPLSITTATAPTMILGAFRMNSTGSPTAGSGYTAIASGNSGYFLSEYELLSSTQSSFSVSIGTGVGTSNGGIADALTSYGAAALSDATVTSEKILVTAPYLNNTLNITTSDSTQTSENINLFYPNLILFTSDATVTSEKILLDSYPYTNSLTTSDSTQTSENISLDVYPLTYSPSFSDSTTTSEFIRVEPYFATDKNIAVTDTTVTYTDFPYTIPASLVVSGSVNLAYTSGLPIFSQSGYSVCGRFKFNSNSSGYNDQYIYFENNSSGSANFYIESYFINNSFPTLRVNVTNSAGVTQVSSFSSLAYVIGLWNDFIWTDNNGVASLYINGIKDPTNYNYTPSAPYTLNQSFIGNKSSGSGYGIFGGNICQIVAVPSVMTAAQISAFHLGSNLPTPATGIWQFNEGSGSVAHDVSGNGNTGTITSVNWSTDTPQNVNVQYYPGVNITPGPANTIPGVKIV